MMMMMMMPQEGLGVHGVVGIRGNGVWERQESDILYFSISLSTQFSRKLQASSINLPLSLPATSEVPIESTARMQDYNKEIFREPALLSSLPTFPLKAFPSTAACCWHFPKTCRTSSASTSCSSSPRA
jgi:hypothetical protein